MIPHLRRLFHGFSLHFAAAILHFCKIAAPSAAPIPAAEGALPQHLGLHRRGAHRASVPQSGLSWKVRWLRKAVCTAAPQGPLVERGLSAERLTGGLLTPPSLRATSPNARRASGEAWAGAFVTGARKSQPGRRPYMPPLQRGRGRGVRQRRSNSAAPRTRNARPYGKDGGPFPM